MTAVRTKGVVIVLMVAMAAYLLLLGQRAIWLIEQGTVVSVLLGVGVLILPVIGVTIIVSEWRFGASSERLARHLAQQGWTPESDPVLSSLPRRPSGRVERTGADEAFSAFSARVENTPEDWTRWYQLAVAYDLAGDRPRARRAMRRAIALEKEDVRPDRRGDAA